LLHISGELWLVNRDRLPTCDEADDGLGAYASPLDEDELPSHVHARGPNLPKKRRIPPLSLNDGKCVDPESCHLMKRILKSDFDDAAERLTALDEARGYEWPEPRPLTLQEAGEVLERLARNRDQFYRRLRREAG
jgi:hypothetical protein